LETSPHSSSKNPVYAMQGMCRRSAGGVYAACYDGKIARR